MIFDWLDGCKKIEATGRYLHEDEWDLLAIGKQEIRYGEYLRYNRSLAKDIAFVRWASVKGGYAEAFATMPDLVEQRFDWLWKLLSAGRYARPVVKTRKACIRQGELDAINKADAPLWVKQYWFGVLVWLKCQYLNHGSMKQNQYILSWILQQVEYPQELQRNAGQALVKWNKRCKIIHVRGKRYFDPRRGTYIHYSEVTVKGEELVDNGANTPVVIAEIGPDTFSSYLAYVTATKCKCKQCGKEFEKSYNRNVVNDLCGDCKKKREREVTARRVRKSRQLARKEDVTVI